MRIEKILLLFLIIFSQLVLADINSDISVIDLEWKIGNQQPSPTTIAFTSSAPENVTLSLNGEVQNMMFLQPTTLSFTNTSLVKTSILSYNLPSTPGFYRGNITYSNKKIPVYLSISQQQQQNNTQLDTNECKLKPITASDYIQTIKSDAGTFTQKFTIKVSSKCLESVYVSDIIPLDTIQTDQGMKPIRLTGPVNLGDKEPGEEITFNVLFDVSTLNPGVYSPFLKIVGTYQDNPISTQINFQLTVTNTNSPIMQGTPTPIYTVPDSVAVGQEFEINVHNLDPNYQPQLQFNTALVGTKVERDASRWKWVGFVNQSGKVDIAIALYHQGGPIGQAFIKQINVIQGNQMGGSGRLKFDLFPAVDTLVGGEEVSVLTRDNETNNIVESTLYLDGQKIESNKVTVVLGKQYCFSAVAPSYNTADMCFQISLRNMDVTITPNPAQTGEPAILIVKDSTTGLELNATAFSTDGQKLTFPMTFLTESTTTIIIKHLGYIERNFTFDVKTNYAILIAPEQLKKKTEAVIKLNKPASWKVDYVDEAGVSTTVSSGTSDSIVFLPKQKGVYNIYAGDKLLTSYTLQGFSFPSLNSVPALWIVIFFIVLTVIIVLIVIAVLYNKKPKVGFGVPSLPSESITESI